VGERVASTRFADRLIGGHRTALWALRHQLRNHAMRVHHQEEEASVLFRSRIVREHSAIIAHRERRVDATFSFAVSA